MFPPSSFPSLFLHCPPTWKTLSCIFSSPLFSPSLHHCSFFTHLFLQSPIQTFWEFSFWQDTLHSSILSSHLSLHSDSLTHLSPHGTIICLSQLSVHILPHSCSFLSLSSSLLCSSSLPLFSLSLFSLSLLSSFS